MRRAQVNETYLPFNFFEVGLRERQLLSNIACISPGRTKKHSLDAVILSISLTVPALNHGNIDI